MQVIAPQIANIEASIFESLEENIQEFMNGRRWTNDEFEFEERIECTMQITISEAPSPTSFRGNIQVQSSRPVFNSDYNSAMLLVNDGDFEISWDGSSNIQFSIDQYRDNLSSILAYYAYLILGMDYDSMALDGGTTHYLKAQTIVANAQNSGPTGWKASQGNQNRYWLVENMLSQTFRPVRNCLYYYHRMGLDQLFDDVEAGRLAMADALIEMRQTHRIRPSSYNLQLFFLAKSDEILKVFGPRQRQRKPVCCRFSSKWTRATSRNTTASWADLPFKHVEIPEYPELRLDRFARIDMAARHDGHDRRDGSGKSIVLGALGLLLGSRSDTSSIRTGTEKCTVEGVFSCSPLAQAWLQQHDLDSWDERLSGANSQRKDAAGCSSTTPPSNCNCFSRLDSSWSIFTGRTAPNSFCNGTFNWLGLMQTPTIQLCSKTTRPPTQRSKQRRTVWPNSSSSARSPKRI